MEKITKSSDKVLIDPNEPLILPDGTALVGRVEWFLYALCCLDYQNLPTPMSRIEEFANALITGEIPNIQPQSRAEQFFLAILDGNISDLPQPQSRSEVLLDKLARGEFDLSDVEPIQSRYELLLAYLIKNGGIGNIDYVLYEFSEAMKTMYNTVEKPFKSLELSGNTLVNCVLEDTENDDYTSFDKDYSGTSFTINGTSEGAIKSAILSGNTLVNLFNVDDSLSVEPSNKRWKYQNRVLNLIGGNKYYVYFFNKLNNSPLHIKPINIEGEKGAFTVEANTGKVVTLDSTIIYASGYYYFKDGWTGEELKQDIIDKCKILFFEYQEGMENWDIPYFEGMQSVKMPVVTTTGNNLIDKQTLKRGYIVENGEFQSNSTDLVTDYIKILPNTKYTYKVFTNIDYKMRFSFFNENKSMISRTNAINVTNGGYATYESPSNACYVRVHSNNFNVIGFDADISLVMSDTPLTSYEPYKSNILTVNEEVELRGIGDVQDELNLLTGELTERIGEITFDGSDDETWGRNGTLSNNYETSFFTLSVDNVKRSIGHITKICDKFPVLADYSHTKDIEGVTQVTDNQMSIRVLKTSLSDDSVEGLKAYLQSNPITVQYQFITKSVKTVDLNVVDQNNNKIDKIHVFNETTHVNTSSDELTPTVNIGKSVSYPTIIKPNTKYTVDLKRNDKPLTVNLGGTEVTFASGETRKTITTPSTLTNDKLSYYGVGAKCNEIMLIEGEIERNIDYFTGMQSVVMQNQMPILSTVGKNLFNPLDLIISESQRVTCVAEPNRLSFRYKIGSHFNSSSYIQLEPNTKYWITITTKDYNKSEDEYVKLHLGKRPHHDSTEYGGFVIKASTDGTQYRSFTTDSDAKLYINGYVGSVGYDIWDIMLEKVEDSNASATPYEPYKSSILSLPKDSRLRGIGDVQDTLDCLTSEVTQRIGEIVLDGSEIWSKESTNNASGDTDTTTCYYTSINDIKLQNHCAFACKELPYRKVALYHKINDYEGITKCLDDKRIFIRINQSRLTEQNINGFKQWLSQNPITIQYELETPVVTTTDLSIVDQDGNAIPKIKSYKDVTHLEVTVPKQSLLPHISAEVATDNSKDMSSLTTKYQEISEAQSAIQDNIQSQSDEIDTALMATTEIFESILE